MPVTGMPIASAAVTATRHSLGVHLRGDIVDRAALMQVGGATYPQPSSLGAARRPAPSPASATVASVSSSRGMLDSPPVAADRRRLCGRDQVPHAVVPRADDLGRQPQRGGDDPAVDHHEPEVVAGHPLVRSAPPGGAPGRRDRAAASSSGPLVGENADGDAPALFAARRFDDDLTDLLAGSA